jgi:transcriptional regulator
MVVHACGVPRLIDGRELYALLDALVTGQESRSTDGRGYSLSELPDGYVQSMMKGIVGFAITVARVEASFKLSQNTDPLDHDSVTGALLRRGDTNSVRITEEMARRRP